MLTYLALPGQPAPKSGVPYPVEPGLPATARILAERQIVCDDQHVGIRSIYDLDGNENTFELVIWSTARVSVWVYWDRDRQPDGSAKAGTVYLIYPTIPLETMTAEVLRERFPGGICQVWRDAPSS
jgi:hypothetical protein